ncbi:MAG: hypothetical protein LBL23_00545 [Coriobacteriales bacterium]|jgi:hypothetical protein|nr:hypothetical protein [Coriobacteriales bacterium]
MNDLITEGLENDQDSIYPPSKEQIEELRSHKVGLAIRLATKLGRPLEDWEWEIFKIREPGKIYEIQELPSGRFKIA